MKLLKFLFKLIVAILLLLSVNSCCQWPEYLQLEVNFENFDFSTLDSVLLIKTNKNNINKHLDTTVYNLTKEHSFIIFVDEANIVNYIIKEKKHNFEHIITDVKFETITSLHYRLGKGHGGCAGYEFGFKFDGIEYENKDRQTVTITP